MFSLPDNNRPSKVSYPTLLMLFLKTPSVSVTEFFWFYFLNARRILEIFRLESGER